MTKFLQGLRSIIFLLLLEISHSAFIHHDTHHREKVVTYKVALARSSFYFQKAVSPRKNKSILFSRPQDNLVSGIAEISLGFSLGVLWSEYSVALTGCGPLNFSDTLERVCYQGMIIFAGLALFNRIVTGKSLEASTVDYLGQLEDFTLVQVKAAEYASALAVLGAFLALAVQYSRGETMDGLSGIDISMCRAIRDL